MAIKPKSFNFINYKFITSKKRLVFNYRLNFHNQKPLDFAETILLPKKSNLSEIPKELLNNILESLHYIIGISYYKTYLPNKFILKKSLNIEQAKFWNSVYQKGLGEFFYKNKIDPKKIAKFKNKNTGPANNFNLNIKDRALVGIGGGKDSIVATELLKKIKYPITALVIETQKPNQTVNKLLKELDIPSLKIRRLIDTKLLEDLPQSLNGHIPISTIFAHIGYLCCVLYDYKYFIVGNEYSSNYGNIKYKRSEINHQWSKSLEFEKLFQNYTEKFLCPDIKYFSLMRPFYEIRIVELFAKYKKYFPYFTSCNKNFRINHKNTKNLWCGECAKCVFMFLMLSAFLSKKNLLNIFKQNLFNNKNLLPIFKNVLGFGKLKPFDCVGTFEESQAALYLSKNKFSNSYIHKKFLKQIKNPKTNIEKVFKINPINTVPTQFQFLGMKNALILGYGVEGKTTKKYLKNKYPNLKIGIADISNDKNYLEKQKDFDITIKTPGLSKEKVYSYYTTATNTFFANIKNQIIGITGTKGKSTTASLIYHIFKTANKKVKLVGNIGNPMLLNLLKPINKGVIFITELSSYQLDDIKFSPNVAVIINLFPDHINYHGDTENYYSAKKNIINFQNNSNWFIYNQKFPKLQNWADEATTKKIKFNVKTPIDNTPTKLIGKHNLENIRAAYKTAKLFNISDSVIKKAITTFKPLKNRLEFVGKYKSIKFYNDSISTTPESTIAAIKSLSNIKTIFLGGEDRGYNFSELEKAIRKYKIKNIVLFPDSGKRILTSYKGLNILNTTNMQKAILFAYNNTPKNSICLLSCASPSYTLWKNFEEKGNEFVKYVKYFSKKII